MNSPRQSEESFEKRCVKHTSWNAKFGDGGRADLMSVQTDDVAPERCNKKVLMLPLGERA